MKSLKTKPLTNVVYIFLGNIFGQLSLLLLTPVLTRIYPPEYFGKYGLFVSILSIFSTIICLKYELAIMLPKDDKDSSSILILCLIISLIFGGFLLSIFFLFSPQISSYLQWEYFNKVIIILVISFILKGLSNSINEWNSRKERYIRYSLSYFINSFITFSSPLLLYVLSIHFVNNLIIGVLIGNTISFSFLLFFTLKKDFTFFKQKINLSKITYNFHKYFDFPRFTTIASLINEVSWQIPSFAIAAYFSKEALGYYTLAFGMIKLPVSLMSKSISQVFYQRISEEKGSAKIVQIVEKMVIILTKVSIPFIITLFLFSPNIFSFIFSKPYSEAGKYVQILSPWIFIWFLSSPLSRILFVYEKQKSDLYINLLILISRLIAFIVGVLNKNLYLALFLYSLLGVVSYGYLIIKALKIANVEIINLTRLIFSNSLSIFLFSIPLLILKFIVANDFLVFAFMAILLIGYYLYEFTKNPYMSKFFLELKEITTQHERSIHK